MTTHETFTDSGKSYGDPNDKRLRKVELEVLIPKIMREKAKAEKCGQEVKDFEQCCKETSIFMVIACRQQNSNLRNCLENWYQNENFKAECKNIYLEERSEFRRTGIKKKNRNTKLPSS